MSCSVLRVIYKQSENQVLVGVSVKSLVNVSISKAGLKFVVEGDMGTGAITLKQTESIDVNLTAFNVLGKRNPCKHGVTS
jgi:hypothetical protein